MTDEPNAITFNAKAWQEGFAVGRRGGERTDNPYPPGDSALAWINGFLEGKAAVAAGGGLNHGQRTP